EEIVWMLQVDERRIQIALAGLKGLRRAAERPPDPEAVERVHPLGTVETVRVDETANRPWLERKHSVQRQVAGADAAVARCHDPVLRLPRPEVGEPSLLIVVA